MQAIRLLYSVHSECMVQAKTETEFCDRERVSGGNPFCDAICPDENKLFFCFRIFLRKIDVVIFLREEVAAVGLLRRAARHSPFGPCLR